MGRAGIVRVLKIALPLAAVGIFASTFLFSNARFASKDGLSFDGVDLSALDEGLKLANPRFTGATNRGEPFSVTAKSALPDGPKPTEVAMEDVTGQIQLEDGRVVTLSAEMGVLYPQEKVLDLTKGARFATSDGYSVSAATARMEAETSTVSAAGGVMAEGPIGRITSDELRATRGPDRAEGAAATDKAVYIWFEKRVKVRIDRPNLAQDPG